VNGVPAAASWFGAAAPRVPAASRALWVVLAVYALIAWWSFGSGPIGSSWRESDTQAIARNFVEEGFDLLHPRVDWRGNTDGSVECECPLYQGAVAAALAACGDVEWPGRLLSLLSLAVIARALFALLERRAGSIAALVGTLAFVGSAQAAYSGTRLMPDTFSTAFAVVGLERFVAWLHGGRTRTLVAAIACTAVGALAKPTAAQVVLLQALWLLALAPARRRDVRAWIGFAAVAALVAAWTWHARAIGTATGLTFGVTFGDTKMPALAQLVRPSFFRSLLASTLIYGMAWFGALALLVLAVRRRLDRADVILLGVVALALVGSLRYSHDWQMGPQYHMYSALAGGWLVARAWPHQPARRVLGLAAAALVANAAWSLRAEWVARSGYATSGHLLTAAALREVTGPHDLLAVRGPKPRFDTTWSRPNNFEEPVLLYQAHRKGWILPVDGADAAALASVRQQGAKWYVDTAPDRVAPETTAWLAANATFVAEPAGARIYSLKTR
jgi:hypothetical protein